MTKMPPLPPMSRPVRPNKRATGTKAKTRTKAKSIFDLDRQVMWREAIEGEDKGEPEHVYGTCAKCGRRRQALDLTWRPDRMVFGELHLGFWACIHGCEGD